MARQNVEASDVLNDGRTKINANFVELYAIGNFRGAFNGNGTDVYPSAGTGSGTAGAIQAGDEYYESSGTAENTAYGGTVPIRTIYKALTAVPGSDATKWRLI